MATTKRKRNVRGKDWHAWAFYFNDPILFVGGLRGFGYWAQYKPPSLRPIDGRWVRVKFIPIDPTPKAKVRR